MDKVIIFAQARTGSTHFANSFFLVDGIRAFHEPLNATMKNPSKYVGAETPDEVGAMLTEIYKTKHVIKHVDGGNGATRSALLSSPYKVLFLQRRNLLQQAVSECMSYQSGVWNVGLGNEDQHYQHQFEDIPFDEVHRIIARNKKNRQESYKILKSRPEGSWMRVWYEDIFGSDDIETRLQNLLAVMTFTGRNCSDEIIAKLRKLLSKEGKLNKDYRAIPNFDEIAQMGSGVLGYLEEPTDNARMICSLPFTYIAVQSNGDVWLCCPAWIKKPIGNLLTQTFDEVWNGKQAMAVRQSMFDGTFVHCNRSKCPHLIAGKTLKLCDVSQRPHREAIKYPDEVGIDLEQELVRLPHGPLEVQMCHDFTCNLRCPSCRGRTMPPSENSAIVHRKLIEGALKDTRELTVSGQGDPFASPLYRSFLENFDHEAHPKLKIKLLTNGTLFTPEMWARIAKAQDHILSILVSIDGATKATYEMNRVGANFEELMANLDFIHTLKIPLLMNMVVQANNYREMPLMAALAAKYGAFITFNKLLNMGTFTPEEYKARSVMMPDHPEHEDFKRVLREVFAEFGGGVQVQGFKL